MRRLYRREARVPSVEETRRCRCDTDVSPIENLAKNKGESPRRSWTKTAARTPVSDVPGAKNIAMNHIIRAELPTVGAANGHVAVNFTPCRFWGVVRHGSLDGPYRIRACRVGRVGTLGLPVGVAMVKALLLRGAS